ncbi:hypothetical protein PHAVU_003G115300 [Phaseolus vulgaris]|uniref:UBC core domain-containing protein n=2 Tax=Phaseolus vulgaris TaxID=3885 RepID=V7C8C0_PHAVU|nr:hypothetical protein PHAVU_003G115300g [Phaseolus vulgaris]ESW26384.1 hypothetical protein PHAVU_003G115300g [Phaseolus vulgaris]
MKEFKRFDVVMDDTDHRFRDSNNGKYFNDSRSSLYKTIMREWKILEKNLPESIYVRVYERRIDLMRAVIVGAQGTPYHDGLFFFDIVFPFDFPDHPPKLHYHSFGYRLNPNLYSNGTVCLSLLNTWHGKMPEMWDPSKSTMLQVLHSIQALVLNEKPFFNEPGVGGFANFSMNLEKKSCVYNEKAYFSTCKTTHQLLRRPPRNFEEFVSCHFRQRAARIIEANRQYVSGRVRIGYYSCESAPSSSSGVHVSQEFKHLMKDFSPGFVYALRRNCSPSNGVGFRCTTAYIVVRWNYAHDDTIKKSESKGGGFFKTVMDKIKKSFGWKNNIGKFNQ